MSDKNRIIIFDTTMRDGEQSPGATMSLEEKIQIARCFDELGIDVIEAGFPIASPGDFEAVTEISKVLKKSIPAGLSRATKKDIDACKDSLKHAKRFRIHTFISTSPLHMKHKLNKTPEQVLDAILKANLFTYFRQRPFNVIPNHKVPARDIFISGLNTGPLSVDLEVVMAGQLENFQNGINAISKLTEGNVYLTTKKN